MLVAAFAFWLAVVFLLTPALPGALGSILSIRTEHALAILLLGPVLIVGAARLYLIARLGPRPAPPVPRENRWNDVRRSLPSGWTLGSIAYDPGLRAWAVTAQGPRSSGAHTRVTGTGISREAALDDLSNRVADSRSVDPGR